MSEKTQPLVNKVAQSGLITFDLETLIDLESLQTIDIAQWLFKGLVLKEKEFRQALKEIDWTTYKNSVIGLYCSTDAIIPKWAYMLLVTCLKPYADEIHYANENQLREIQLLSSIESHDFKHLKDQRVIIKGCGEHEVPASAYLLITNKLLPIVQSLMFGEACSTVPIYKKKK